MTYCSAGSLVALFPCLRDVVLAAAAPTGCCFCHNAGSLNLLTGLAFLLLAGVTSLVGQESSVFIFLPFKVSNEEGTG